MTRIGGEFELTAQDFGDDADPAGWPAPATPHGLWTDTGRSALALAVRALLAAGARPRAHLPAFGCVAMVEPFRRAGVEIVYYPGLPADAALAPVAVAPHEIFVHVAYFGLVHRAGEAAAARARAAGAFVIEDRVQASLDRRPSQADFVVTSLRKVTAAPDGARLGAAAPFAAALAAPDEASVSARLAAKLLRGANAAPGRFLPLLERLEAGLPADAPRAPAAASRRILSRLDWEAIARRRRDNWRAFEEAIAPLVARAAATPALGPLGESGAPLGYPLRVADGKRDALRRSLAAQGVFCPVHWDISHVPDATGEAFSRERALSAAILTMPVDQRATPDDMRAAARAMIGFFDAREG